MLIQMAGAPQGAPASVSDAELQMAFRVKFGLSVEDGANFYRGYQLLSRNPKVKLPVALEDETGHPQWSYVLVEDAIEPIVERWIRTVPGVAEKFRQELVELKGALYHENGMSQGGLSRLMTHVPTSLFYMLKALDDHFWDIRANIERFLQAYPMMGGHK